MNATHEVVRAFPGPGDVRLEPGTRVDASEWRNRERLTEQRFLRSIQPSEARPTPEVSEATARGARRGGR